MKKKVGDGWIQTRDSAVSIRCVAGVPLKLMEMKEKKKTNIQLTTFVSPVWD
jgi:hypothetical protein